MANPIVTITMENGDMIKAELYPDIAPITVENFVKLVKEGFYDGLTCHRIISGFMRMSERKRNRRTGTHH